MTTECERNKLHVYQAKELIRQKERAPGSHRIYSTDKSTGMELNAKPGETYYVRVDIQVGFSKGHGGVTLVDPQEGKYEVAQAAHQGADNQ